ncbi:hypothetical protein DsansV1_C01g0000631 [Dioscorea sansibarensis]
MSQSLVRRRSRGPLRRRSPLHRSPIPRHRSHTPSRRILPQGRSLLARCRSPTPSRRRSPHCRSPLTRRRPPTTSRMKSPDHRPAVSPRSSSYGRHRSTTLTGKESPQHRSPIVRSLSRSPTRKRSVSPASGRSSSPSRSSRSRSPKKRMSTMPSSRNDKPDLQILIPQRKSPSRSQSPSYQIGRGSNSDHNHHSNGVAQFRDEFVSERADKKKVTSVLKKDSIDGNEHSVSRPKASDSVVQHISKYAPHRDLSGHAGTCNSPLIYSDSSVEPAGKIVSKKNSLSESSVKQRK